MAEKPQLKIAVKARGGEGKNIGVFAFWRREGKLSGALDSRVKRMALLLEDGTRIDVMRDAEGKLSHFVNAFEEAPPQQTQHEKAKSNGYQSQYDPDEELPF